VSTVTAPAGPAPPESTLTGLGTLVRFTVRLDRVRMVVWVLSIVLTVVATVASIKGLYPTQADLDKAAVVSQDNAAAIIFNGPAQGLRTVGGEVAFNTGTFGLILMGLMSVFLLGKLTRGEEEAGRAELVRSLPVGAYASPAASLVTVGAINVVTGLLVTVSLIGLGLPSAGSAAFGLGFTLFGLFMAAVTLVAAQVTENTRVVYGIGGMVIGAAFLLRAIGDVGDGTISWLSPIGWAQKTRPFAGEQWWPFLVLLGATAGLAWLTVTLSRRRDLGGGLVRPRAGRVRAAASLGRPVGLAVRLQRGSVIGWTAGLLVLAIAYGWITDSINSFVSDNQTMTDFIAAQGHGTLVEQYLAMSFRILALIAGGFAIQSALRIRSEETAGRAEPVIVAGVSRSRFAWSHLIVAFGGTLLVLVVNGLGFGVTDALVTGTSGVVTDSLIGSLVFLPAVWLLVAVAVALVGLAPRATAAAWAVLGVCFVIGMFGQLLDLPMWVQDLSPFQHPPRYPAAPVAWLPLIVLTALTAALTAAGLAGFRHRDLA
jgi:ABC-2 type transport system permease protein